MYNFRGVFLLNKPLQAPAGKLEYIWGCEEYMRKYKIMQRTQLPDMFYGAKRTIFQNACELRKDMTPAEKVLWNHLNKSQLGVRFKAQHPIDIFIADFYCHKLKLVVEVDGEIHESQKEYDKNRTVELEKFGLNIIRFTNNEVINDIERVIEDIKKIINAAPSPFQ